MAQPEHTPQFVRLEEAITVLFCLIDDAYTILNPKGRHYESIKRLSDSEIITLTLLQQLRGIESQRSFLRDAQRFFSRICSRGCWASTLRRSIAGFASSGVTWSL